MTTTITLLGHTWVLASVSVAVLSITFMAVLIVFRVPIGIAMILAGLIGGAGIVGWPAALGFLSTEAMTKLSSPDTAVAPMFLLMGQLATVSGLSGDLYRLGYACVGHVRGGLAMATIAGCGFFGAICGSAAATTATFTRVALPEMLNRNYSRPLACGVISAGGCLGTLMPPSVPLVLYAIMAEQFILELFLAAFIPAFLFIFLLFATIWLRCLINPDAGPPGQRQSAKEVLAAFKQGFAGIFLLVTVLGGIYGGVFTVNEGAAVGCILALIFALARGAMTFETTIFTIRHSVVAIGMIYIILIGAGVFNYLVALTQVSSVLIQAVADAGWTNWMVLLFLISTYVLLGTVFDEVAAMLITLPLVIPLILDMGYSLVWWGIVNMVIINLGQTTPPIGLNLFVVHGLTGEKFSVLYRGILPFNGAMLVLLAILMIWPDIALFLPRALM